MEYRHPGIGGAAVLDQRAGARLCLARAAAKDRGRQPIPAPGRRDRRAAGASPQHFRHRRGDPAHPVAVHGAAALRHHAEDPARSLAGGRQSRRRPRARVLADFPAALAAGRAGGRHAGVRAQPRLLHHAGTARGRPHDHGVDAGEPQCRTLRPMGRGQRRRRRAVDRGGRDIRCRQPVRSPRSRVGAKMKMPRPYRIALITLCTLVLLFLILPILIIAPLSFSSARFLSFPPPSLSLRWYQEYVGNPAWMQATRVTLTVAVLTVIIATPLGVAAAYAISQSKWRIMRVIHMTLLLPLVVPIIITAVGIFFVYAKVGLVASMTGLVLANVMLGLPYVVISVAAGLQSFDAAQEMVARSLGMSRLRSFFVVTLPQIKASVIAGGIFAFISAMDETVVALFISGGQYQPLTKRMFTALRDEIDPTIAAISTLMTAASFMLVLIASTRQKKGA